MSYKLTYFDVKGRGEPIRMLFTLAKVKFTDNRVKKEDWAALKPTTRWGVMPTLHVGDKEIGQSSTILRFLARKFKFTGADEWESTRCDEFVDALKDLEGEYVKFLFAGDAEKKEEARTAMVKTTIPKFFGKINTMQHENGGTWLVGQNVTWADLYLVCTIEKIEEAIDKNFLNSYPHLRKTKEAFLAIPEIKTYIEKRP